MVTGEREQPTIQAILAEFPDQLWPAPGWLNQGVMLFLGQEKNDEAIAGPKTRWYDSGLAAN